MSTGLLTMLIGLFVVPVFLLYLGHRLRRRSRRARGMFWGALIGHTAGAVLATIYSMVPPEEWQSGDTTRGFFGLYAMLLFAIAGSLSGYVLARDRTS